MSDSETSHIPLYPTRTVWGSATPQDPIIFWAREATEESQAMIEGIEKVCRQGAVLMRRTIVVVRPSSDRPGFYNTAGKVVKTAPFIEVAMGNKHSNRDFDSDDMDMEGLLFYIPTSASNETPLRLATPWESCEEGGANPDMYEIDTNNPHPNASWVHEQFKKVGKVDDALKQVMEKVKTGYNKA